jgi:predicted metal-dependent HD superfamily phosphohydrolase
MHRWINTKDPAAVAAEARAICQALFPEADNSFVDDLFCSVNECFRGGYEDYQAVDIRYHDFEHTLQGTLCMVRLLDGFSRSSAQPRLTPRMFQLGLAAILLHDTGYLKKRSDTEGTGAKYTLTHVGRSADFAAHFLPQKGFTPEETEAVQKMICCTGVDARPESIPFRSEGEKVLGLALATADLLGQMSAPDYVEKLPALFAEFAEAVRHTADKNVFIASFSSVDDLIERTPAFWQNVVRKKLDHNLGGMYRFLNEPTPGAAEGRNPYLEQVEANMERLKKRAFAQETSVR